MQSTKVAIVGCGNVGSRHLQAIAKLSKQSKLDVKVVEPNPRCSDLGKARLAEVVEPGDAITVEWLSRLDDLSGKSDLAIVATGSHGRAGIISNLLLKGHRTFLVEKMVCQSTDEYNQILERMNENDAKGWVNCILRYFPFYQDIKTRMGANLRAHASVFSGNVGLASNAIHYFDLFSYLLGGKSCSLDGTHLDPAILVCNRGDEYREFAGSIIAHTSQGDQAVVSSFPDATATSVIQVISENVRFVVDEGKNWASIATKEKQWEWEETEFRYRHVSELSTQIALDILENGACKLPSLEEMLPLHQELFRVFGKHLTKITGQSHALCPIT